MGPTPSSVTVWTTYIQGPFILQPFSAIPIIVNTSMGSLLFNRALKSLSPPTHYPHTRGLVHGLVNLGRVMASNLKRFLRSNKQKLSLRYRTSLYIYFFGKYILFFSTLQTKSWWYDPASHSSSTAFAPHSEPGLSTCNQELPGE